MRGDLMSLDSTNELTIEEKFDDAKGVIRSHKTKDRQYYDQKNFMLTTTMCINYIW
jgi:hypothetical protein